MTAGTLRSSLQEVDLALLGEERPPRLLRREAAGSQQIGRDVAGRRVCRASHIAFDFPDELLDALGGPHGLLALHADDGAPGFLVRQIELDQRRSR